MTIIIIQKLARVNEGKECQKQPKREELAKVNEWILYIFIQRLMELHSMTKFAWLATRYNPCHYYWNSEFVA
jgi:hypothetical protein